MILATPIFFLVVPLVFRQVIENVRILVKVAVRIAGTTEFSILATPTLLLVAPLLIRQAIENVQVVVRIFVGNPGSDSCDTNLSSRCSTGLSSSN